MESELCPARCDDFPPSFIEILSSISKRISVRISAARRAVSSDDRSHGISFDFEWIVSYFYEHRRKRYNWFLLLIVMALSPFSPVFFVFSCEREKKRRSNLAQCQNHSSRCDRMVILFFRILKLPNVMIEKGERIE